MSKKKHRSPFLFRTIGRIAVIAAIVGCGISIITIQSSIAQKKTELAQVNRQIESLEEENEQLRRILDSGDIDGYMERLAREEYNYAYPDEHRYYDISRN